MTHPVLSTRRRGRQRAGDRLKHIGYCTGPAQLVYLLAAWDAAHVDPSQCAVLPFEAGSMNDELLRTLSRAVDALGLRILDELPQRYVSLQRLLCYRVLHLGRTTFWFSRGHPKCVEALQFMRCLCPGRVFEYYDGYRSPLVAREVEQLRCRRRKRRKMLTRAELRYRILMADKFFMPRSSLWLEYAPKALRRRTVLFESVTIQKLIRRVGMILKQEATSIERRRVGGIVMLTGMFSERFKNLALADEVRMYEALLQQLRKASASIPILLKVHPRTSKEKEYELEAICSRYSARLFRSQQLVEYLFECYGDGPKKTILIGPPSTALMNAVEFGYGLSCSLSPFFLAEHLGHEYLTTSLVQEDHDLMLAAGARSLDRVEEIEDIVFSHL